MSSSIIIVVDPLLALTAAQMAKIEVSLQDCGSVTVDKLTGEQINGEVLPRMYGIVYNSESTMYIFISPPKLAKPPAIIDALFMCHA